VAIETMLVVMVLGTLTQVPFHHDLGTLKVLLALSIPAPPTIHKHYLRWPGGAASGIKTLKLRRREMH
jgi:hypothetical protein